MQLIAMAKRDTLGMENAVAEMAQAGFNETQIQQAYNMRRGYYRVLPRSFFQKASDEAERMVPELESNGQLVARAYPNPFNPSTTIEYAIPETMPVKLRVFDLLGRGVARLVDGWQQEGTYAEVFDASRLPSGVYVYVLSTPYSHVSGRLLLMK